VGCRFPFLAAKPLRRGRPAIDRSLRFDDLHQAYLYFTGRARFGKIVLSRF